MYRFWFAPEEQRNRTVVLVGRSPEDLTGVRVETRIRQGSDVHEITTRLKGQTIRRNYYRIVSGYHPD
jgi:hypothetical protein